MAKTAGDVIRAERQRRGLSIYKLSQMTKVHPGSIHNLEIGSGAPENTTVKVMIPLVAALWPKLTLAHFARTKGLRLAPVDKRADRRLRGIS